MDKGINKKLTNKTSSKNIKSHKKTLKIKDSLITSSRTPRSGRINVDFNKNPLEKFKSIKSIPTITYRQIQTTIFPSELNENQQNYSYFNHTECKLDSDIQNMKGINIKRLLSDRRPNVSFSNDKNIPIKTKVNPSQKINPNSKNHEEKFQQYLKGNTKTQLNKKSKIKERRNTTLNIGTFESSAAEYEIRPTMQSLIKRTSKVLLKYRVRQQEWRKQKLDLVKQLQKYKRKANGNSITTTTSSHNSQSYKLLI